jgi:cation diffusion facilitator family transporter
LFEFLSKKFVKDYKNIDNLSVRLNLISLSGLVGIIINFLLFLIKIIVGVLVSSTAVIGDAFNNISDAVTSLITMIGAKASKKPADSSHPWGHGRSEYIASFVVSILIMYVGYSLLKNSIISLIENRIPNITRLAIIILTISLFFKLYIYFLNDKLGKKLNSELNMAVKIDARNDMISSSTIIIASILQRYTSFNLDAILSIFISFIVFLPGLELFRETIDTLLGKKVDKDLEESIGEIILRGDFVIGYHDLQVHEYGKGILVGSCDVEVPENISVGVMHESISQIEDNLRKKLNIKLTIHMDPTYSLMKNEENKEILERLGQSRKYGNKDIQNK